MSPHEFPIPVHDLDAAGKPIHFRVRREWLRGAFEGEAHQVRPGENDGELDVRVSKSGADVVVHGRIQAELETDCARCLQPAKVRVDEPVSVLMVPASSARDTRGKGGEDEEEDLSAEEADVLPYDGETVVLDDLVRDELLLAIPMIPLCSEACPGMSPPLGSQKEEAPSRGVDPRLAPLLEIRLASPQQKNKKQKKE
jgi:uncharacterized protein